MTNQERAAHIVRSMITVENPTHCQDIVQTLADAGLLMPDLPEPVKNYESVFTVASPLLDCRSVQAIGDQVAIHGYKSRHASSGDTRRFAYALLAAANLAEEQK